MQRADASQLRQPAEHGKMRGVESGGFVPQFAEGGLHDLFGLDRVAQDAEGQGPEAQRVACRQLREGATVSLGDPLQQGDIRYRLLSRRACLYDDACHVASLEWALGIKSPAAAGRSRAFFKLLTARQLARKLGLTQFCTEGAMVGLPPSHFRVTVHVGNRAGEHFEPIEALVDTGATYTWIPRNILKQLGVTPEEEWPFVLADGREVRYPVAWIQIQIGGRAQPTIAVFGEPASEPILGVFALEGFRLAADPVNRRLISVPGLLKTA